jgi:lysophospholipase
MHQYSVYTYDHQSQGLSGRWLSESQSTWVHSFDDYVDDFVFFMTMISRQISQCPMNVVGHSMGCLIAAIGMSRHPSLGMS